MNTTLTVLETIGWLQVPLVWYLFKRYAKRNVAGELISGAIFGVFFEMTTEPLWDYHFAITFYRDIPVGVVTGWMVMFTLVVFISEKLYCFVLHKEHIVPRDKRIFIFDLIAGTLVALPMETIGAKLGVWTYRNDLLKWDWNTLIPFFNMPYELIMGYSLVMLIAPTFVRYWEKSFE
jgi:hypothetical protein